MDGWVLSCLSLANHSALLLPFAVLCYCSDDAAFNMDEWVLNGSASFNCSTLSFPLPPTPPPPYCSDDEAFNMDEWVLNTEAHPLRVSQPPQQQAAPDVAAAEAARKKWWWPPGPGQGQGQGDAAAAVQQQRR
jgi:hypothetical protein